MKYRKIAHHHLATGDDRDPTIKRVGAVPAHEAAAVAAGADYHKALTRYLRGPSPEALARLLRELR
jgi:hypothetical protein